MLLLVALLAKFSARRLALDREGAEQVPASTFASMCVSSIFGDEHDRQDATGDLGF